MRSFVLAAGVAGLALSGCSVNGGFAPVGPAAHSTTSFAVQAVRGHVSRGTYSQLYAFKGAPDGATPYAGLAVLRGVLYATTRNGSSNACTSSCQNDDCSLGCGTVFSLTEFGKEDVVYDFRGDLDDAGDGSWPFPGLTELDGTFYGTTNLGGKRNLGTVFSVSPSGQERVLHSFRGGRDGANPQAGLVAVNGVLYGTTVLGGGPSCGGQGCGTVFEVSKSGSERVVHTFTAGTDGANAYSSVTPMNGALYGATLFGGGHACGGRGCGTIYSLTTGGVERVIYSFTGADDGGYPNGLIVRGKALYGTTLGGGTTSSGTVFTVSASGAERVLYDFQNVPDGSVPAANLIDLGGTFYGTTNGGGSKGDGTVFSVTPSGNESVLYSFQGGADGANPQAPLVALRGALFGTTTQGGSSACGGGCGTVFRVSP